ncbi:MAG: metalloregulator ArsR/SmtB family transcription factor [Pseudomonadota bacterium]
MNATCAPEDHPEHEHPPLDAEHLQRAARMGSAMGEPGRLTLLALLLQGRHCVSELTAETGESTSLVSQRLKVLTDAELLHRRREGKHVYYSLADDHVRILVRNLLSHAADDHQ